MWSVYYLFPSTHTVLFHACVSDQLQCRKTISVRDHSHLMLHDISSCRPQNVGIFTEHSIVFFVRSLIRLNAFSEDDLVTHFQGSFPWLCGRHAKYLSLCGILTFGKRISTPPLFPLDPLSSSSRAYFLSLTLLPSMRSTSGMIVQSRETIGDVPPELIVSLSSKRIIKLDVRISL
jgi:hypothetical protein